MTNDVKPNVEEIDLNTLADPVVLDMTVANGYNSTSATVGGNPSVKNLSVFDWGAAVTGCAREPNNTWDFAELQVELIQDELDEVKRGLSNRNPEEFYDGIMDVIFLASSFAFLHQHDYNKGYGTMCEALFSRFDDTEEDALLTKEKYINLGVETYNVKRETKLGTRWVTYVAETTKVGDDNYPKDKWLKSHKFHQPDYTGQLPTLV